MAAGATLIVSGLQAAPLEGVEFRQQHSSSCRHAGKPIVVGLVKEE